MGGASEGKIKVALTLMPFDKVYDDIYLIGIKEVFEERGFRCIRIDEQLFSGLIIKEIQKSIAESDVIVAEMTDKNANVYYEVGYAHGIGKQPILITKETKNLPFDLRGYKHINYGGKIKTLREELNKHIDWLAQALSASREIIRDPTKLKETSKAVLVYLYNAGEERPAVECAERAKGVYAVMNDLRFLGYVQFYGPLLPTVAVRLTELGKEAAEKLMETRFPTT